MPLRAEPNHRAEQISQLLFGERAEILQVNNKEWAQIRCEWDGYKGWCKLSQLQTVTHKQYRKEVKYFSSDHKGILTNAIGNMPLPLGAELFGLKKNKIEVGFLSAQFKGKKKAIPQTALPVHDIITMAHQYLHAPYLWGGRSIFGIDCSGLTQMAYKLCGISLPRDASEQAQQGKLVDFLPNTACGDLAFFQNEEGTIVHVGILLDSESIIHATDASGRVVIDSIDQAGIISRTLKKRTHQLRFVKRIIS